ncbi:toll/interleukin-1 receptor domain-containing protein [Methanobacterium oryzae]|uniref:toll/interleukin-1 receptor domain-containing protein n=1 Tax=Methanobacterium oryzae TaxID=69540 RepID=UPI003D23B6D5
MAQDVYISHHLTNRDVADSIRKSLDVNKIDSWMVPKDKDPENEWSPSIVNAIKETKIFVLILSLKSNESPLTSKEVEMAKNYGKTIIIFKLEDIKPSNLNFIESDNIIDSTEATKSNKPYDEDIEKLVTKIQSLLIEAPELEVPPKMIDPHSKRTAAIGSVLIILMVISGYLIPLPYNWLLILVLLLGFFILLGYTKGNWNRILVDERNQMSLSRFQTVVWTLIILSAFFAMALASIKVGVTNPTANQVDLAKALDIGVPWQLWAIIGISITSLVGSPLILSTKKDLTVVDQEREDYYQKKLDERNMKAEGTVCVNQTIEQAKFTDIFTGDEIADCRRIDMAKVQMFFFTIIVVVAYSVLIFKTMMDATPNNLEFPILSQGIIALLAISHGAYLTEKAVPSTPTKK